MANVICGSHTAHGNGIRAVKGPVPAGLRVLEALQPKAEMRMPEHFAEEHRGAQRLENSSFFQVLHDCPGVLYAPCCPWSSRYCSCQKSLWDC